jgi:hypothetical protein
LTRIRSGAMPTSSVASVRKTSGSSAHRYSMLRLWPLTQAGLCVNPALFTRGETGIQRPAIPAEVLVVPVVQGTRIHGGNPPELPVSPSQGYRSATRPSVQAVVTRPQPPLAACSKRKSSALFRRPASTDLCAILFQEKHMTVISRADVEPGLAIGGAFFGWGGGPIGARGKHS